MMNGNFRSKWSGLRDMYIYIYIYTRTYKYERLPVNVINMDGIKGILMKRMRIIVFFYSELNYFRQ